MKKIPKKLLAAIRKQTRGTRKPTKVEKDKTKYDRKKAPPVDPLSQVP